MFKSLRIHRNYRLFFAGQVISLAGTWMQNIALAWFVVELTDSPLAVGGLAFCRFLPFMLFGLYAGVIADRFDNRKLVMATQARADGGLRRAHGARVLRVGEHPDRLPPRVPRRHRARVDAPGRQALTFQMVGRDELPNAIALNTGLFNGSRIIGPAIAGVIIGLGGTGICFLVNTITFLAVLTALALMRPDELFEVKRNPRTRAGAAIAEGVRFAWSNPEIRLALTVLAIASTVGFNFHVIIPVLASDTLNAGPEVFGVLSAFFGGGALLGALIQAARSKASWKALLIGATGFSAGLLALAPVSSVAPACAILFFVGICFTLWVSNTSAILQLRAPDALRGRVMSLFMFAFAGLAPIGGLFAGWLMEVGGTQLALSLGGSLSLVVVAYAWTQRAGLTPALSPRRA